MAKELDKSALTYAVSLIDAVCCVSGSPTFVEDIRANRGPTGLATVVARRDTAELFNWMMESFSYQGISNSVAESYLRRHGSVRWRELQSLLARGPKCPLLANYWAYEQCRYDKTSRSCSKPDYQDDCPLPTHQLRNGRLNQTAYSLYLFIRDVARGDLFRWIDTQLVSVKKFGIEAGRFRQDALVVPMRSIFGVSDKVLTMTLSEILMSAPKSWPGWFEAGSQMIAVDTLVHNFLHRTGILDRFDARHGYGVGCYRLGGCADILRRVTTKIDSLRFNSQNPANFPRFIQHALWNYCSADGLSICNGLNIDDRQSCPNIYCIIYSNCSRIPLYDK
jgi:hypothetical protein